MILKWFKQTIEKSNITVFNNIFNSKNEDPLLNNLLALDEIANESDTSLFTKLTNNNIK